MICHASLVKIFLIYIVSVFKILEGLFNLCLGKEGCDEAYFSVIICRKATHFTRQEGMLTDLAFRTCNLVLCALNFID